jgi:hypothetical protein
MALAASKREETRRKKTLVADGSCSGYGPESMLKSEHSFSTREATRKGRRKKHERKKDMQSKEAWKDERME